MKPSERRAAMKKEMAERLQESYNSKDGSGKFKSIFNKGNVGNTPFWKCSEDEHFINIIPYVAGKLNPNVKEGKPAYNLDIYVHQKVGINEDSYVCLARSFGKKCPICDEQNELRKQDDYDEKYVKSLTPKRRVVYNIEVLDSEKETKKGIQLWEVSHWLFEKELAELAKKPKGGGFVLFADPDEGKTICFRKKGSGPTSTEYKAFQFMDRDEPITDAVLDAAMCLDELIHIPTYEEVKNAFYGTETEEEPEEVVEERKHEAESSRRTPAAKKFKCPGTRPDDFGELDDCENCPDVADCEAEYVAASEEAEADPEPEPEPEPAKESEGRRGLRRSTPEPEKETDPEPASEGRRIRRRPGA